MERELQVFAKALQDAPQKASEAMAKALNSGGVFARKLSIDNIYRQLNLEKSYIEDNLVVSTTATAGFLRVKVFANKRPVLLPRYGAEIRTKPAKSALGEAKGDPSRGIPAGRKAWGSKPFSVKRGGKSVAWPGVFFIRLRGSNTWGVAERFGKAKKDYQILYGPSVDQAFKDVSLKVLPEAYDFVEAEFIKFFGDGS